MLFGPNKYGNIKVGLVSNARNQKSNSGSTP